MTAYVEIRRNPQQWRRLETTRPGVKHVDFGTVIAAVASFPNSGTQYLNSLFSVPENIDTSGAVTFRATVSPSTGTASKKVAVAFEHVARANGETVDGSYTAEESDATSITSTTGNQTVVEWTETVSNLGWAAGDLVVCRVSRANVLLYDLDDDMYLLHFTIRIPITR